MSQADDELYPCVGVCMVDEASGTCLGCGKQIFEPAPPAPSAPAASVSPNTAQD